MPVLFKILVVVQFRYSNILKEQEIIQFFKFNNQRHQLKYYILTVYLLKKLIKISQDRKSRECKSIFSLNTALYM